VARAAAVLTKRGARSPAPVAAADRVIGVIAGLAVSFQWRFLVGYVGCSSVRPSDRTWTRALPSGCGLLQVRTKHLTVAVSRGGAVAIMHSLLWYPRTLRRALEHPSSGLTTQVSEDVWMDDSDVISRRIKC
jgi:hypothetical protein